MLVLIKDDLDSVTRPKGRNLKKNMKNRIRLETCFCCLQNFSCMHLVIVGQTFFNMTCHFIFLVSCMHVSYALAIH